MKCSGYTNQDANTQKSKEMTEEKLAQAKKLEEEISRLRQHYRSIKTSRDNAYESSPGSRPAIKVEPNFESREKSLMLDLLPIDLSEFMELYLTKVEKQIKKLEKEFEKL